MWGAEENISRKNFTRKSKHLPIKELHNLYFHPIIIKFIKSRTIKWAGHVARMGANIITI